MLGYQSVNTIAIDIYAAGYGYGSGGVDLLSVVNTNLGMRWVLITMLNTVSTRVPALLTLVFFDFRL